VIALYAVTWHSDTVVPQDDGLALLADGDLAMVVGPAPATTSREDALAHARIVEQIASAADVLPIRYGTTAHDTDEAHALLREHGSAWAARLQKVEGCAELAIRAALPEADEGRATSGAEHMGRLVSRSRMLDATEAELGELLTGRCRVMRRLAGHDELKLSCLVERESVERVRLLLEEWSADRRDLAVTVTGPWAPYSFAADGEDSGVAL
jgi:hypothetical protein